MYIKRKSQRQENRTAKEFSGRAQIASGAIETLKGDVRTGENKAGAFNTNDFLIENKFTDSVGYKLTVQTWKKISKEAFRDNFRTPLMQIDIQDIQVVVFDVNYAKVMRIRPTRIITVPSATYTLKVDFMREMFSSPVGNVLELFFSKTSERLIVMSKEELLFKLG